MYPLLILREEIVCLIVLIFLWLNGRIYKLGKDNISFKRMLFYAIGHVVFDIITILTVNNIDVVPKFVNLLAHGIFYMFAILFAREFFCYILKLTVNSDVLKKLRIISLALLIAYMVALPFLPIEYLQGNGSKYSFGMAAYVGYAIAMLLFISSAFIVIVRFKKLEQHVKYALVPMLIVMVVAECLQIAIPELLFTGGAVTIISVGFFFSLENPAIVFKKKYLMDALTGVKNRHSYEADMKKMEAEYASNNKIKYCIVFIDINNLKAVNDRFGHLEGDEYIGKISSFLVHNLQNSEGIYRMGGDEFLAIYRNKDEELIKQEIQKVNDDCIEASKHVEYKVSTAIGYAMSEEKYKTLREVLKIADYMMFKNKADFKKESVIINNSDQKLDITGLTDRIFDAFAATGDRNYLTLCNLSTNVSRWSKSAVDYFGLPGEFMFDCMTSWVTFIHPDDVALYWEDISDVFSGKKKYHDIEYRIRNKDGEYVMCTCRGTILKGKNGEPDMFAATLVNHGIAEKIDSITGLYKEQHFLQYIEPLIIDKRNVAFLEVGISSFNRINILYNYYGGNNILKQFAELLSEIIGEKDEVFRMNGTKFILCLPDSTAQDVYILYSKIHEEVRKRIKINDNTVTLQIAGGAFIIDQDFKGDVITIRNNLSSALTTSKKENHGKLYIYGMDPKEASGDYYNLLTAIHKDAISEKTGFYIKYQPTVNMKTGKIIGAEALLRWKNEEFGNITPDQFIPWLENDPCFFLLGKWILTTALNDAKKLLAINPNFILNVNLTVLQLEDDRFDSMIIEVLKETNFPPENLYLELTERCRELDNDFLIAQIEFLHSIGIKVALDDVGTGFSSIDILLRLPLDEIKLDKNFINGIQEQKANQVFVRSIIDAAHLMGYQSCIEGIEDEQTYNFLKQYNADIAQGYYFSKPVSFEEIEEMLRK